MTLRRRAILRQIAAVRCKEFGSTWITSMSSVSQPMLLMLINIFHSPLYLRWPPLTLQHPPREVCLHLSESVWKLTKRIYTLLALILQSMFVECTCFWPVQYMSRDQTQYDLKLEAQTHRKRLTHMFWSTSIILNGCTHTKSVMRCVKLPWRLYLNLVPILEYQMRTQRVWRELQEIKR